MNKFLADPRNFWEDKIIQWEDSRYRYPSKGRSLTEQFVGFFSHSLRSRMDIAEKLIFPHIKGKRVVELGCGSGILAEEFIQAGAEEYLGFDIAENAIQSAYKKMSQSKYASKIRFERSDILSELKPVAADFVFSLGLFDWLTVNEMEILFSKTKGIDFLHSLSEKRVWSIQQIIHRLYVYISYGYKTGSYTPRYYNISRIITIAKPYFQKPINIYRSKKLSFGVFLTTLPIDQ